MNKFDEREKSFEKKFQMDEELQFKVSARSNKYLGEWVGEKLGKNNEETKQYEISQDDSLDVIFAKSLIQNHGSFFLL